MKRLFSQMNSCNLPIIMASNLKHVIRYLAEKAADEQQQLSRFSFVRYKQHLLSHDYKPSTINKKVNSLKVFNDYLQQKGVVEENYIPVKRDRVSIATGSERVVQAMTDKEVEKLLFYIQDESKASERNRFLHHSE